MRSELVAFHPIPGEHTGEHIAQVIIKVLKRLHVLEKVSALTTISRSPLSKQL